MGWEYALKKCDKYVYQRMSYLSPRFFKKAQGILLSPPSIRPSFMLSPPKPLNEIQPNLACELLT